MYKELQKWSKIPSHTCYLGIIFTCSGSFTEAIEHLCNQAQKALFKLKQKGELLSHIITAFKLFDTLILPILGYCAEIWLPYFCNDLTEGKLYNLCDKLHIERLHLKFCKYLLGVHRKASNTAVRAELGRYPLLITFLGHAIKYWLTLCNSKKNPHLQKLPTQIYTTLWIISPTGLHQLKLYWYVQICLKYG